MRFDYTLLLLVVWPIAITVVTQLTKVLIKLVQTGKIDPHEYYAWGKFPSSHIALVSALATVAGLVAGLDSLSFGLALALAVIVTRDALGLRMFVEQHSRAINILRQQLPRDKQRLIPKQIERVGHTPLEAFGGATFGIGLTLLLYWILAAI
ncbi:MAG: divergent PAP2 family protein [Candidatus Andersenbacteria bacterium]